MPFVKGQSGNPAGRPTDSLTAVLRQWMRRKTGGGQRHDRAIIESLLALAEGGNLDAIKYIFDRLEGRLPSVQYTHGQLGIGGYDGGPIRVAAYDYHVAVAAIATRPEPDRLAPGDAQSLVDGETLG